jgi:glucose/arabinose dehydrogenase
MDRTEGSPGMRPCPLLDRQAGVWRFDADRVGQDHAVDGSKFVTGTRNIVALEWDPFSGSVYAAQHGRDQLAALHSQYYDDEASAELPSEEFMRLVEGDNFGWPYCYHDRFRDTKILGPEYGGDGLEVGECAQYAQPLVAFPGHWGPNDLVFYTGDQFPDAYQGGAFIAFHGSWNRAPLPQGGYQVAFVPTEGGEPTGGYQTFADGFAGADPLMDPNDALHRPTGLAVGPDGSLYVSDDAGGRIWRIVYTG